MQGKNNKKAWLINWRLDVCICGSFIDCSLKILFEKIFRTWLDEECNFHEASWIGGIVVYFREQHQLYEHKCWNNCIIIEREMEGKYNYFQELKVIIHHSALFFLIRETIVDIDEGEGSLGLFFFSLFFFVRIIWTILDPDWIESEPKDEIKNLFTICLRSHHFDLSQAFIH